MWMLPMVKYTKLFKSWKLLIYFGCDIKPETTKQPILFSPILSTNFSRFEPQYTYKIIISILWFEQLKKETNFSLVENLEKICLDHRFLFSFSIAKQLGKKRLFVWWFDVTNKIIVKNR